MMSQVLTVFHQIDVSHHLEITVTSTYVQTGGQNAAGLLCGDKFPRARAQGLQCSALVAGAHVGTGLVASPADHSGFLLAPAPSASSPQVLSEVQGKHQLTSATSQQIRFFWWQPGAVCVSLVRVRLVRVLPQPPKGLGWNPRKPPETGMNVS